MKGLLPELIKGGFYKDERGKIDFINDFDLSKIKRMYFTQNSSVDFFRAWQGHKIESRWFFCVKGSFSIKLIEIDDWLNPSDDLRIIEYILEENEPQVLFIPPGYVNGFQATTEDSKLMILSDYKLNEIENDDVRFDSEKWIK